MKKSLLLIVLAATCALPAAAQTPLTQQVSAAVERAQAKAVTQAPAKHCMWCGRAETADVNAPCPADPDVHCTFVANENTATPQPAPSAKQANTAAKRTQTKATATPISSNHCMWCGRVETDEPSTPCPADPDVHCHFVADEAATPTSLQPKQEQTAAQSVEQSHLQLDYTEYAPGLLYQAEELLQKDRDQHAGYPVHTLDYYYYQLLNK